MRLGWTANGYSLQNRVERDRQDRYDDDTSFLDSFVFRKFSMRVKGFQRPCKVRINTANRELMDDTFAALAVTVQVTVQVLLLLQLFDS